jgi:hypothetical protein
MLVSNHDIRTSLYDCVAGQEGALFRGAVRSMLLRA